MNTDRISSHLRYMTIQILTSKWNNTNWNGFGTGFLYCFEKEGRTALVLVTNKHVIDGAVTIGLRFHITEDGNNTALPGPGRLMHIPYGQALIVRHPLADVDLAAINILPLVERAVLQEKWQPYVKCLNKTHLPTTQMMTDFGSLEDVIMVGYPNGLVDSANNFPILRRGITSTPYSTNYQARQEFLADIPVYGGSSGSPIFVINEGSWSTPNGIVMGSRFALIGILYAGHIQTLNGPIVAEPVPTNIGPFAKIDQMINLGLCIKSCRIEELADQLPHW